MSNILNLEPEDQKQPHKRGTNNIKRNATGWWTQGTWIWLGLWISNDTAKEKIEQLGKATKAEIDPKNRLTLKIQKKFC